MLAVSSFLVDLYNEGIEAAKQGQWGKVRDRFDRVAESADDSALRSAAESASREIAAIDNRNRIVDRHNAAIEMANRRDLAGAIKALEALLAEEKDWEPDLRAKVEKTLDDLRAARKGKR